MTSFRTHIPTRQIVQNIAHLIQSLSPRRRIQMILFFFLQLSTAALELLSIGSIVPFLHALTNADKLMLNPYIVTLTEWAHVTTPQGLIALLAVLFGVGVLCANVFRFLTLFSQQYLSAVMAADLGDLLFSKTLHRPYPYFTTNNSSEMIGNITNDLNGALGTIYCLFSIITQGLTALFITAGLLSYNTGIAFILSVLIMVLYGFVMFLVSRRLQYNSRVLSDSYKTMLQILQEGFGGIRYIILGKLQKTFVKSFHSAHHKFRNKNAENNVIQQTPKLFLESLGVLAISIITLNHATQNSDISSIIPLVGFLVFSAYRLLPAVQQIFVSITGIISLSVSTDRVAGVVYERPGKKSIWTDLRTHGQLALKDKLVFQNVSFDYHGTGEKWTVRDLNFTVPARTTVALVGHTGSGKSTIGDLILGLLQPQRGKIIVDGTEIDAQNLAAWQAGIAHVPQNIFLSDATIAENIAFGIPFDQIDMDQIKKAARLAQIDDFIEGLPEKYLGKCGERGVRLSGGQRQRIGIARALYQNASLIVFDEATSALDNKTEQDVVDAIGHLQQDLTIVLIAHRLSTLKFADNILVFHAGELVAQGTYAELADNPHFTALSKISDSSEQA